MKTLEELLREGWENIASFGHCWVMARGNERILWNPRTREIEFKYERSL